MSLNKVFGFILIVFLMASCQPKAIRNLTASQYHSSVINTPILNLELGEEQTYRANVKGFQQSLSGLLIVKNQDTNYRFLMITDFGLKVFDLSLNLDGDYDFHHVMKHMDYDFLKNSLAMNLFMLLPVENHDECQYFHSDDVLIYYPQKKMLYFVNDNHIVKVQRFRGKKKVWAEAILNDKNIKIDQNQPAILIELKELTDVE